MFNIKKYLKTTVFFRNFILKLDNQIQREQFIKNNVEMIKDGSVLLDAGCGSQRYKQYCSHLKYKAQDFGEFTRDEQNTLDTFRGHYQYGKLDYKGNIWNINEVDNFFDVILCTEVLEHIPFPNETIKEFSRLLKSNGILLLTLPSNCLRHMDPFFFYTGFSDRWILEILKKNNFEILDIETIGDYYSWMSVEILRNFLKQPFYYKIILFPSLLFFYFSRKTQESKNTLCMGYNVIAKKL